MPFDSGPGPSEHVLSEAQRLVNSVKDKEKSRDKISKFQRLSEDFYHAFVAKRNADQKIFARSEKKKAEAKYKELQADIFTSKPTKEDVNFLKATFASVRDQHTKLENQLEVLRENKLGDNNTIHQLERHIEDLGVELLCLGEQLDLLRGPDISPKKVGKNAVPEKEEAAGSDAADKNDESLETNTPPNVNDSGGDKTSFSVTVSKTRRGARGGVGKRGDQNSDSESSSGSNLDEESDDSIPKVTNRGLIRSRSIRGGGKPQAGRPDAPDLSFANDEDVDSPDEESSLKGQIDTAKTSPDQAKIDSENMERGSEEIVADISHSYFGIEGAMKEWISDVQKVKDPRLELPRLSILISEFRALEADTNQILDTTDLQTPARQQLESVIGRSGQSIILLIDAGNQIERHGTPPVFAKTADQILEIPPARLETEQIASEFGPKEMNERFVSIKEVRKRNMDRFAEMEKRIGKGETLQDENNLLFDITLTLRSLKLMLRSSEEDIAVFGHTLTYNQERAVYEIINELDNNIFTVTEGVHLQDQIIQHKRALEFGYDTTTTETRSAIELGLIDKDGRNEQVGAETDSNEIESQASIVEETLGQVEISEEFKDRASRYTQRLDSHVRSLALLLEESFSAEGQQDPDRIKGALSVEFTSIDWLRNEILDELAADSEDMADMKHSERRSALKDIVKKCDDLKREILFSNYRISKAERRKRDVLVNDIKGHPTDVKEYALPEIQLSPEVAEAETNRQIFVLAKKYDQSSSTVSQIEKALSQPQTAETHQRLHNSLEYLELEILNLTGEIENFMADWKNISDEQKELLGGLKDKYGELAEYISTILENNNKEQNDTTIIEHSQLPDVIKAIERKKSVTEYVEKVSNIESITHDAFVALREAPNLDIAQDVLSTFEYLQADAIRLGEDMDKILRNSEKDLSEEDQEELNKNITKVEMMLWDLVYGIKEAENIIEAEKASAISNPASEDESAPDNVVKLQRNTPSYRDKDFQKTGTDM